MHYSLLVLFKIITYVYAKIIHIYTHQIYILNWNFCHLSITMLSNFAKDNIKKQKPTHARTVNKKKVVRKYNNAKSTPNLIDRSAIEDIIIKSIINLFKLET